MAFIVDRAAIMEEMEQGRNAISVDEVLSKASAGEGLTEVETSQLLQQLVGKDFELAGNVAESLRLRTKGAVAALYTCLYVTNLCVNDCGYCGFRSSNSKLERITLSEAAIERETIAIRASEQTNAILIGGTLPEEEYRELILRGVTILQREGLNPWIEFENLSPTTLTELRAKGGNHFILFQETYDQAKYERWHCRSPLKRDYTARLQKIDDAIVAGFENIGIGALFGLTNDPIFEVLGLYHHTKYLQQRGANVCISIPTLKSAPGLSIREEYHITQEELERIAIVLRLALPDISLALSGRERPELRDRLFGVVDHVGCGGRTNPGARTTHRQVYLSGSKQFELYDMRTPAEIKAHLLRQGIDVVSEVNWGAGR